MPDGNSVMSPMSSSWDTQGQSVRSPPGSVASNGIDLDGHNETAEASEDETRTSSSEGIDQPPLMLSSVNGEKGEFI